MFSRLTALVGGGSSLPFELGEEFPPSSAFCNWQHFRATAKADGAPVSVFRLAAPKGDARLDAARNGAKRLRALRHPNVLRFVELVEAEEQGRAVVYVVTEAVTPLSIVLAGMDNETDRAQYLGMGLGAVVAALSFLSNDCSLVHGAVGMAAVAVTHSLDWKLHGFDVMSDHQFASQYDLPLTAAAWLVPQQYKPGEVAKGDWQVGGQRAGGTAVGSSRQRRPCSSVADFFRQRRPGSSVAAWPHPPHQGDFACASAC
jgi:SCY1-like protein 1